MAESKQSKDRSAEKAQGSMSKAVLKHAITVVGTASMVVALVWMLVLSGQGFQLKIDNWKPEISVSPREDGLGRVLDNALETNERDTRAILRARDFYGVDDVAPHKLAEMISAQLELHPIQLRAVLRDRGYYQVTDPALTDALAELSPTHAVSARVRRLLFQMEGPFEKPSTLEGAQSRFITDVLASRPPQDSLVAEVWSGFILQTLSFLYPDLKVRLVPVDITERHLNGEGGLTIWNASACRGSHLANKYVQLWVESDDGVWDETAVTAYVNEEMHATHCRGAARELPDILRDGKVRLGVSRALHERLNGNLAGDPSTGAESGSRFAIQIYPAGYGPLSPPWLLQESEVRDGEADPDAG